MKRTSTIRCFIYRMGKTSLMNMLHLAIGRVDKRLAMLAEKDMHNIIVVAIDHAERDRIVEYTPSYPTTSWYRTREEVCPFFGRHT